MVANSVHVNAYSDLCLHTFRRYASKYVLMHKAISFVSPKTYLFVGLRYISVTKECFHPYDTILTTNNTYSASVFCSELTDV